MPNYLLFESSLGYALFEVRKEPTALDTSAGQKSITDYSLFKQLVDLVAFAPFLNPQHSLENANAISEGILHEYLFRFLEGAIPNKENSKLGVLDLSGLGKAIKDSKLGLQCHCNTAVKELLRGIRHHIGKLTEKSDAGLMKDSFYKAQLGLGHAYSRSKVKFNVKKVDNVIVHSISMLDQLDKDLNTYSMRAREWYSYHFPELAKIVKDNTLYAKLVSEIGNRESIAQRSDIRQKLLDIVEDEDIVDQIIEASKSSLGFELSEVDQLNISSFTKRLRSFQVYRAQLFNYLTDKMRNVAPNLTAVTGEVVGARLISQVGSLHNLAKASASTIQVLGAEKALFRALKARSGRTPKHGLLFNAPSVTKVSKENKGRIARMIANKCAMAVNIDVFSDEPTSIFGETFRQQVEDRVRQLENGEKLNFEKNSILMEKAVEVANRIREEAVEAKDEPMTEVSKESKKENVILMKKLNQRNNLKLKKIKMILQTMKK